LNGHSSRWEKREPQHTFEYAEAVLDSGESLFSERLHNLLGDEIWNFNLLILDRI